MKNGSVKCLTNIIGPVEVTMKQCLHVLFVEDMKIMYVTVCKEILMNENQEIVDKSLYFNKTWSIAVHAIWKIKYEVCVEML